MNLDLQIVKVGQSYFLRTPSGLYVDSLQDPSNIEEIIFSSEPKEEFGFPSSLPLTFLENLKQEISNLINGNDRREKGCRAFGKQME